MNLLLLMLRLVTFTTCLCLWHGTVHQAILVYTSSLTCYLAFAVAETALTTVVLCTVASSCAKHGLLAGGVTKAAPEPGRRRLQKAQRHALRKRMEQLGSEQQGMLRKRLQHLEHQLHRQLMHTASGGVSHIFAELYALREQVDKPADHDWSMMDSTWLLSGLPSHLRSLLNFSAAAQGQMHAHVKVTFGQELPTVSLVTSTMVVAYLLYRVAASTILCALQPRQRSKGRTAPVQEVPLQGKPTGCSLMAVRLWLTAKAIVAWPVHLPGLYALKTMSTIRAAAAPLARIAQAALSGASACANNLASRVRSMAEHKMSEMPDKVIVLSTPPLSPHHHCGSSWQDLVSPSDSPSLHSSEDTMDREADLQRRLHAALQRAEHAEQRSQQLATEVQGLQSQVTAAVDRAQKAELRADGLQTQLHDAGQGRKAAEAEVSRLQAQVDSVMQRALTAEGRADRLQFDQLCPLTSVPTKIDLPVVVGFRESQPASCDALSKVIASSEICSESSPTSVLPPTTEAFGPAGHAAPQQDAPQARTSQDSVEPDKGEHECSSGAAAHSQDQGAACALPTGCSKVAQLVSPYWDATFRAKHTAYCQKHGRDWDGMWVLGPSFAKGVYELCMPGNDLGTMGQGAYGKVSYAETEYKEERVPLAVKTCKFMKGRESLEHRAALEEVHALKMAKGKAHIIQEVRAKFHDVTTNGARIVTRAVEGCTLDIAVTQLHELRSDPAGCTRHAAVCKKMTKQLTEGMKALHDCNRCFFDLKPANILVSNWMDPARVCCTLIDLGGSLEEGTWDGTQDAQYTTWFASPDVVAAAAAARSMSAPQKPVLLLRNDIWALGCMLVYMLTNKFPFFPSPEDFKQEDFCVDELEQEDFVMERHLEWALMLRAGGTEGMFHYPGPLDDLHKFLPNPEQHKHACKLLRRMLSPAQEERPVCDTILRSKFVASPVDVAGVALPNTAV